MQKVSSGGAAPQNREAICGGAPPRHTAYESEVEMTILVPKNKYGAGYINDISHHHLNKIGNEYEVVLQNNSEYGIIEAQYFKGKLFLVVKWLGAERV